VTAAATKGAMAMATRVAGNEEGDGDGNGNDMVDSNCNKGGGLATAMKAMTVAMAMMRAMAMGIRVVGNIEDNGKGGKGNDSGNKAGG
jgi:hypothetical protein